MKKNILLSVLFLCGFFTFNVKGMEKKSTDEMEILINNNKFSVFINGNKIIYLFELHECPHKSVTLSAIKNLKNNELYYKKILSEYYLEKEADKIHKHEIDITNYEIKFLKKKVNKYAKIELEKNDKKNEPNLKNEDCTKKIENSFPDKDFNLFWRFPMGSSGNDNETTDTLRRVGYLRFTKNLETTKKELGNNPKCSFCGESLLESNSCVICVLCLKAFYCDENCQDNDHIYGHENVCLKSILREKEVKNFDKLDKD